MTTTTARTTPRQHDSAMTTANTATAAPLPSPQYAGLFIEPDLPPFTDDSE
ncbi:MULTISPECIES: hypothetical protein [unclassified Streptomyces]|uniref:hypothetical protein n=1 Tax=Actinomycetes TaxID=1760 RepID=UPI0033A51D12